jgi:hypothetical protein
MYPASWWRAISGHGFRELSWHHGVPNFMFVRMPTRQIVSRSQSDQDCTNDASQSSGDEQASAVADRMDCHERHHSGVSNVRPSCIGD